MTIQKAKGTVHHILSPLAMARNLWRYRDLAAQFSRREVEMRYRGSMLGIFWSLITPLFMILVYTFVFGIIFNARWPQAKTNSLTEFATIIFAGLTVFNIFSESVTRAPTLIASNPNYVKKVVFPLEVLPLTVLGAALFQASVNTVVLVLAHLVFGGSLSLYILLLPVIIFPLLLFSLGISWLLASLGVFIRDLSNLTVLLVQVLFFLTPVFYTVEIVPEPYKRLLLFNPLTPIVTNVRAVVLWGQAPVWSELGVGYILSAIIAVFGYAWFMQTKKAFADVI